MEEWSTGSFNVVEKQNTLRKLIYACISHVHGFIPLCVYIFHTMSQIHGYYIIFLISSSLIRGGKSEETGNELARKFSDWQKEFEKLKG